MAADLSVRSLPALCKSFIGSQQHTLDNFDENTLTSEGATALRMGDLGYQSSAQENLVISYNSLESYISSLEALLNRQHPAYQAMGKKDQNGEWIQLSTTLLQIENEFYSSIRPKQTVHSGEAPILALKNRGIEYVEVRALDVNPYLPLGIDKQQIRFLDLLLLYCLLQESPTLSWRSTSRIEAIWPLSLITEDQGTYICSREIAADQ